MSSYLDQNLLLLLSIEQASQYTRFKDLSLYSWQLFLAEARKKFLVNEIIIKNGLPTKDMDGEILEVDDGISKLHIVLRINGIRSEVISLNESIEDTDYHKTFGLGVSHNQLEHFSSLELVDQSLAFLEKGSQCAMVHQVHAVDDPAFSWDKTHRLGLSSKQWEEYFKDWSKRNNSHGWTYAGSHRGASGRPKNYVLERNGSLPFYTYYNEQIIRKIVSELTMANGVSLSRIPLVLLSFSLAKDKPYLLSALLAAIHALDALDGKLSRKGLGNSSFGPFVDIFSDHFVEATTMFEYAYGKGYIPKGTPWILTARNISTDLLRLYNACRVGVNRSSHPHEAFGTVGDDGKRLRMFYGLVKAIGDSVIPILPGLGLFISGVHVSASITRALPVWTSSTSQNIYKELINAILERKQNNLRISLQEPIIKS